MVLVLVCFGTGATLSQRGGFSQSGGSLEKRAHKMWVGFFSGDTNTRGEWKGFNWGFGGVLNELVQLRRISVITRHTVTLPKNRNHSEKQQIPGFKTNPNKPTLRSMTSQIIAESQPLRNTVATGISLNPMLVKVIFPDVLGRKKKASNVVGLNSPSYQSIFSVTWHQFPLYIQIALELPHLFVLLCSLKVSVAWGYSSRWWGSPTGWKEIGENRKKSGKILKMIVPWFSG